MRRLSVVATLVTAVLVVPATASYSDGDPVKYPAYHRVQQGESMWTIARDFLERATGHVPDDPVVNNEVRQMRRLNRDTLHGSDQVYPGQRLLLAPSNWDVPDGKDGWGTGFTSCTNKSLPTRQPSQPGGLDFRVRLLHPPVDGWSEPIRLVIENRSDRTRRIGVGFENGLLVSQDGSPTAVMRDDDGATYLAKIPPGKKRHVDARVAAFTCGDTRFLKQRLDPGRYRLYGDVGWRTAHRHGALAPGPRVVRVVRS